MEWGMEKDKHQENGCVIKIEDSIVIIICGEVDVDRLRESLQTVSHVKSSSKLVNHE